MTYTEKEIEAAATAIAKFFGDNDSPVDAARAALTAVPREPEGWRLVPVKPTENMHGTVLYSERWQEPRSNMIWMDPADAYREYVAAAPRYGDKPTT